MIVELGHYALILALLVAAVQGVVPIWGAARGEAAWMRLAEPGALLQLLLILGAFLALTHAFVVSDFSVALVANNSHSAKPLLYKITGVWGNHEGSMLLWVLILAVFGAAVALFGGNLPHALKARTLSVQAWISLGFLAFLLFTSNPFERLEVPPLDGRDLNPLLQDPGLAFHPPMLYLGYVGFSMAFSFAVAALIEGRVDPAWGRWVRPWTLLAWIFLTGGIALGSWWAYYELGWGGWWFWDPVENLSFMPWLLGTALLHSAVVVEKRDALKAWTILLAILTFALSLLGTFIVRSGLLTSVHAFAVDPERGIFILMLLGVAIGGSMALYAWRAPTMAPGGLFAPVSREGALILNNLLLAVATATVLIGTLYPLWEELATGDRITVGPPFFNRTFAPVMGALVLLMAVGPFLNWKRADLSGVWPRLLAAAGLALAVGLAVAILKGGPGAALGAIFFGLGAWLALGTLLELAGRIKLFREPLGRSLRRAGKLTRAHYGMSAAHLGLAIVLFGATAAGLWKEESLSVLSPGESVSLAGYEYRFDSVEQVEGPNYVSDRATFTVTSEEGREVAVLTPERRFYPVQGMTTTEAAIHTTWLADLYATIGAPENEAAPQGPRTVRIYHEPLVPWLWIGALVMMLGGALSLSDRRLRVGAPAPSAGSPAAAKGARA